MNDLEKIMAIQNEGAQITKETIEKIEFATNEIKSVKRVMDYLFLGFFVLIISFLCLLFSGCESDHCEPGTFRCKGPNEVQYCDADGNWDHDGFCSDWEPGDLVCVDGDCE